MEINNSVKKTMGRRKIEIQKIQKKSKLLVTFSKRRRGLFRKASELSILCGAEVAILLQSPANKMLAFGNPSVIGTLIDRLTNDLSPAEKASSSSRAIIGQFDEACRRKYEEAERAVEMEKTRMEKGGVWWEKPMEEGMEVQELEEFLVGLQNLRENVNRKLELQEFLNAGFVDEDHQNIANTGKVEVEEEVLIGLDDDLFIQHNNVVANEKVEADEEFWAGLIEGIM